MSLVSQPPHPMIDMDGLLVQASTRTSLEHLLRLGWRNVNLLSREKIDELVNCAVKTIVQKHRPRTLAGDPAPARQIEEESKAEFHELLETYQKTAAATDAVKRSRENVELELRNIDAQAKAATFVSKDSIPRNGRPGPEGAFEDFVRELDRELTQVFDTRKVLHQRSQSPEVVPELTRVEKVVRALLLRLFTVERDRFAAPPEDPREVAILRKRVEKLLAHIATMEAAVMTLSSAKSYSRQQVQNLLRDLGLAQEDPYYEKKKEMLKVVLSENQNIRAKARELAERGITLEHPVGTPGFKLLRNTASDPVSRNIA